jgi:hypothetical protein
LRWSGVVELYGKRVRVWVYKYGNDIYIEIGNIYDPSYEKPVILITSESRIEEDVEALIEEIVRLLRKAVEKVVKGEVQ